MTTAPEPRPAVAGVTDAEISAAMASCGVSDEGSFLSLNDLLDFSGENATRIVVRAALTAAAEARRAERDAEVERKLDDTRADLALANEELFFLRAGGVDDRRLIADLKARASKAVEVRRAAQKVVDVWWRYGNTIKFADAMGALRAALLSTAPDLCGDATDTTRGGGDD